MFIALWLILFVFDLLFVLSNWAWDRCTNCENTARCRHLEYSPPHKQQESFVWSQRPTTIYVWPNLWSHPQNNGKLCSHLRMEFELRIIFFSIAFLIVTTMYRFSFQVSLTSEVQQFTQRAVAGMEVFYKKKKRCLHQKSYSSHSTVCQRLLHLRWDG